MADGAEKIEISKYKNKKIINKEIWVKYYV